MDMDAISNDRGNLSASIDDSNMQAVVEGMYATIKCVTSNIVSPEVLASSLKPLCIDFSQLLETISTTVKNFVAPELSEERKIEIFESNREWGKLGWSLFQDAPIDYFAVPPGNSSEVAEKVKPFCSATSIRYLFDDLRTQKIKKKDLESAIFCYESKQYKACSLLLFGLIEAKLIRTQELKNPRKVGKGAVEKLQQQIEGKSGAQAFYEMLYCVSLFACLEAFFAHGGDFRNEPLTINRNFLTHGMSRREVRKRDCIQLFWALNNLTYCIEHLLYL